MERERLGLVGPDGFVGLVDASIFDSDPPFHLGIPLTDEDPGWAGETIRFFSVLRLPICVWWTGDDTPLPIEVTRDERERVTSLAISYTLDEHDPSRWIDVGYLEIPSGRLAVLEPTMWGEGEHPVFCDVPTGTWRVQACEVTALDIPMRTAGIKLTPHASAPAEPA